MAGNVKRQLIWFIYIRVLILLLLSLIVIGWYAASSYRSFFFEHIRQELYERTLLVNDRFVAILSEEDPEYPAIDQLCEELGTKGNFRITCILPDGRVVGDSAEDVRKMENHADRPEIRAALQGNRGSNVRRSATLNRMMMYAAVPLQHEGELYGVLRSAVSMERLQDKLSSLIWRIGFAAIFIAAAAALAAYRISRSVEIPLESIKEKAVQMSRGDLSVRSTPFVLQELDELAGAMNRMAEQLQERIETISKQSQREDLTLSNLMDGVMTLDERERIVSLNPSAAALLMINPRQAPGLHWQDAVRDPKIREFLRSCLAEKRPYAETVIGDEKRGTFLRLRFGTIRGAEGAAEQNLGSLLLLQDVTQAKRMEIMRRDFVASVSHELRTPVTAIQGYVETLIDDKESLPSHTRDFLETIRRHSSRLINIVEDLLSLSRIEYQSERGEIGFSVENLADWLPAALETCRDRSKERNISLDLESEEQLPAYINGQLISQAVSNLIDNAVKYSPRGSRVQVKAFASDSHYLAVSVSDEGPGIAREHHDRLFERFYRVDKDRSRESGGTGLGLSIVKHIVQAHGGSVTVESEPGAGSTFTFYLPRQTAVR